MKQDYDWFTPIMIGLFIGTLFSALIKSAQADDYSDQMARIVSESRHTYDGQFAHPPTTYAPPAPLDAPSLPRSQDVQYPSYPGTAGPSRGW